ncbi:hypothetical protein [Mycobacteroides abscessus]|uniref:hypothetical protein n=1 Tax=Mycobacteroides abscessus TaxID=36809 RepID=UPI0009D2AEF4|nr:hypothetical protein [Mycobacteroides abscessus]SLI51246.1 Uncharacterised protein [Mycobacteroides abscessus subsp. abscessus]
MSNHIPTPTQRVGDAPLDEAAPARPAFIPYVQSSGSEVTAQIDGFTIATATPTDGADPIRPWHVTANVGDATYEFLTYGAGAANCAVNALAQAYAAGYKAAQAGVR